MVEWQGPGAPFVILCDDDEAAGLSLPSALQNLYGDWRLPQFPDRPYVYVNFVISHDGRASFNVPGAAGGGAVSRFNRHDQWLMGLLRARADAVLVGDNTLRTEPEHCWTAEWIYPPDGAAFAALRLAEGRSVAPLHVFASASGDVTPDAAVFHRPDLTVLIATTVGGVTRAKELLGHYPHVRYLVLGEQTVDLAALVAALWRAYGVRTLLCEGGPTLYGALVQARQIDDEFLTLSPILIGSPRDGPRRPSLVEGIAFTPDAPPASRLLGVRKAGDHLFLRSRYVRDQPGEA